MKKHYFLIFPLVACLLFIILFLQSCGGSTNLPIQGGESPAETIGENDQIEGQVAIIGREAEKATELGKFEVLPIELVQEILFAVPYPAILASREVNRAFYKLTTGYSEAGLVGVTHRPNQIMSTNAWAINKEVDFKKAALKELTPETIPSFPFYQLIRRVRNLPKEFWPYLQGTQVHTLDLRGNRIGDAEVSQLAQHLQGTSVHTLDLSNNQIGAAGASQIAQHLQGTKVHTLNLSENQIGAAGASQLAQYLKGTSVHTLHLSYNHIGDAGAIQIAQYLKGTQVHTLNLTYNQIGDAGAIELAKHLQGTKVHTLHLNDNQISDEGASQIAQHLQGTQVHTLHLSYNRIGNTTQQLLVEQYPHIKWEF